MHSCRVLALLCPGQGSQKPGLLAPWLDLPGVADRVEAFSDAAQVDLRLHGTTSDADTIRDTAIAQPLIVAASLIALQELAAKVEPSAIDVTAGHSVGELAAAAVAGVVPALDAMRLVGIRGRAMAEAAAQANTGMRAVVGGDQGEVMAAISAAGAVAANVNGGGQVVAAGDIDALERLSQSPPARARVIPLQVAGAFHTEAMASATAPFAAAVASTAATAPSVRFLSNLDGAPFPDDGSAVLERLVEQVVAPVRWDLVQGTLADLGVTRVVELAPAGVLTGLARRTLPGVESVAVTTPDDLDAAFELISARRGAR